MSAGSAPSAPVSGVPCPRLLTRSLLSRPLAAPPCPAPTRTPYVPGCGQSSVRRRYAPGPIDRAGHALDGSESPVAPCTAKAGTPVARRGSRCRGPRPPLYLATCVPPPPPPGIFCLGRPCARATCRRATPGDCAGYDARTRAGGFGLALPSPPRRPRQAGRGSRAFLAFGAPFSRD